MEEEARQAENQAKKSASSFRALVLFGVAAAFCAFTPHMMKPSVASKLAEANHPVACPPQWLPVLLAANTPGPPTHHRRLLGVFTTKDELKTAAVEYNADVTAAELKYGAIADWDVSGITDMSSLFNSLRNFNADISSWDTSSVTDMSYMFFNAVAFNQPLSFDATSVTDMVGMFAEADAFNQPLSFDTSSVTDMDAMFASADAFNQPLSFDTSSVTDMSYMFQYASAFNQPLSFDTSSVTDMSGMFEGLGTLLPPRSDLSNTNRLLIRCAWTSSAAFATAGYKRWGSGSCRPPSPSLPPPLPSEDSGGDFVIIIFVAISLGLLGLVVLLLSWKHRNGGTAPAAPPPTRDAVTGSQGGGVPEQGALEMERAPPTYHPATGVSALPTSAHSAHFAYPPHPLYFSASSPPPFYSAASVPVGYAASTGEVVVVVAEGVCAPASGGDMPVVTGTPC